MTSGPIRVVVVEDSDVQRAHLKQVLQADGDIAVIGEAVSTNEAVALVQRLKPDVVTMDLQMPGGGGLVAIEEIMAYNPVPILVLSAATYDAGSAVAVEALAAGALEALPKPGRWTPQAEDHLRSRIRGLRGITVVRHQRARVQRPAAAPGGRSVVAIAASTGGPGALAELLPALAAVPAPILVIQHIHADFVDGFVSWMARVCPLPVQLAGDGHRVRRGVVYIGPADVHLKLAPGGRIMLDPEPMLLHRPSADELFASVAEQAGASGIGVLLTGMGEDGARGLLSLRTVGGTTIVQDEASSVVFGMPRAAERIGAASQVLPLGQIPQAVMRAATQVRT